MACSAAWRTDARELFTLRCQGRAEQPQTFDRRELVVDPAGCLAVIAAQRL